MKKVKEKRTIFLQVLAPSSDTKSLTDSMITVDNTIQMEIEFFGGHKKPSISLTNEKNVLSINTAIIFSSKSIIL